MYCSHDLRSKAQICAWQRYLPNPIRRRARITPHRSRQMCDGEDWRPEPLTDRKQELRRGLMLR
jgi:hypothetical protein